MHRLLSAAIAAACVVPGLAAAQDPFLGEIRCFGYNFVPRGWAATNGQLLPISQNQALFSLLGTQFGGNGQTNFALPDLRGRALIGVGQGTGLSINPAVGEMGGAEAVSLSLAQLPPHAHTVAPVATSSDATSTSPSGKVPAATKRNAAAYGDPDVPVSMVAAPTSSVGSGQPVPIRSPYLAVTCAIAINGIFPSRD